MGREMGKAPMGKTAKKRKRKGHAPNADAAKLRAVEYCLFHYPTLYTGGVPQRGGSPVSGWIVPIMLEDPEAGISEPVGELYINATTMQVTVATPAAQVVAAGKRLYEEKHHARGAAVVSAAKK